MQSASTAASEAVRAVLEAESFFHVLSLRSPTVDDMGHPMWLPTSADVKRAFRKVSLQTHPDKNQDHPDAHKAFQRVQEAWKCLCDPLARDAYIATYIADRPELLSTSWCPPTRDESVVEQLDQAREWRKTKVKRQQQELDKYAWKIMSSLKERLVASAYKQETKRVDNDNIDTNTADAMHSLKRKRRANEMRKHRATTSVYIGESTEGVRGVDTSGECGIGDNNSSGDDNAANRQALSSAARRRQRNAMRCNKKRRKRRK